MMTKLVNTSALVLLLVGFVVAKDWWENEVFYQIYPRSFKDSDGDGVGDLQGIKSKLPYLKNLGINATWISPIFKSPMKDFGYDISDFLNIYEDFGTLADFDELVEECKRLGIKLVLDFVPNHTSDQHEWFQLSLNRTPGYEDFYIWHDGKLIDGKREPPNNWLSAFGFGAWSFREERQQYYLHQFAVEQPDLNYRNPKVVQLMKDVIVFWLERGVYGFRIDAVPFLFEVEDLKDEPKSNNPTALPEDYSYLNHIYTNNLPETYDMVYQWRKVLDDFSLRTDNVTRIMMTEAYVDSVENQILYYGNETTPGAHFTFNFLLITALNGKSSARDFVFTINRWLSYLPVEYISNWVLGNHDNHRVTQRYGPERVDGLNMLLLMLPGIGVNYYGDEIGMLDAEVSWEETLDPQGLNVGPERYKQFSRDPERSPMQWDATKNGGFSTADKTWLPMAPNYEKINVEAQLGKKSSPIILYKKMLGLRQEAAIRDGELSLRALSTDVIALTRSIPEQTYVFVFNLGDKPQTVDLTYFLHLPGSLKVVLASVDSAIREGESILTKNFKVAPYNAYILVPEE